LNKKIQAAHLSPFEQIKQTDPDSGTEFWSSRDFAGVLGYVSYQHFEAVIEKAKLACFNSGHQSRTILTMRLIWSPLEVVQSGG